MVHPLVSGNKWYKLKYNLLHVQRQNSPLVVSFGGPWSNHIHALAAASRMVKIPALGVIRGTWYKELSATLEDARAFGMRLQFIDKQQYRQRDDPDWIAERLADWIGQTFPEHSSWLEPAVLRKVFIVPEGGSNLLGVQGVREWAAQIYRQFPAPTSFVLPVGSGGTLAGFSLANSPHRLFGIPVLKAMPGLVTSVEALRDKVAMKSGTTPWQLKEGFEFGGYGHYTDALVALLKDYSATANLPLEPVYSGKAFVAMVELAKQKVFPTEDVVFIHTGGLQGARGLLQ